MRLETDEKLHEDDWLFVQSDERLDSVVFIVEVDWLEKDMTEGLRGLFLSPDLFSGATLHLRTLSGDASGDLGRSVTSVVLDLESLVEDLESLVEEATFASITGFTFFMLWNKTIIDYSVILTCKMFQYILSCADMCQSITN